MATLKQWWKAATKAEQEQLAKACEVGHWSLYTRTATEDKSYFRAMTAELASAVERAAELMHKVSGGRLPMMKREELCDTCRSCPHALASRKDKQKAA